MKILVFGLSSQRGGVESFIINYCTAMVQHTSELEFEFVVFDAIPSYASSLQEQGYRFHIVPNRVSHPLRNRRALQQLVSEGGFDCLWYHVCTLSDITLLKLAVNAIPIRVVHSHNSVNMGNAVNGFLHNWHKAMIANIATDYLACSSEAAQFMFPDSTLGQNAVRIVANGVDVERFRFDSAVRKHVRKEHEWEESLLVVTAGRIHRQKNPFFLIEIIKKLTDLDPHVRLLYLGDGPLRKEVIVQINELGLEDAVDLLGPVDNVQDYLFASDIFLLPSLFEGLPFAAIEAQAAGLPVLMADSIPEEAILADNTERFPLTEGPDAWARRTLELAAACRDRDYGAKVISICGFSIKENAASLSEWLLALGDNV